MSLATLEGTVAFANLTEHEVYNNQSTGKFSLVVSLDEATADELDAKGVKLREYEGVKQRKFSSKFDVPVLNPDGSAFNGRVTRGSKSGYYIQTVSRTLYTVLVLTSIRSRFWK